MPIPNRISIIWLGSRLRKSHQERILEWMKLNPSHEVSLWVNPDILQQEDYEAIQAVTQDKILLRNVNDIDFDMLGDEKQVEHLKDWITSLYQADVPNYAALSDIYRYLILAQDGGWYFDTDIIPKEPLPVDLKLPYDFAIHLIIARGRGSSQIGYHAPAILVSSTESAFIKNTCQALFALSNIYEVTNPVVLSPEIGVRKLATCVITGIIAKFAASRLRVGGVCFFHYYENHRDLRDSPVDDLELCKQISLLGNRLNQFIFTHECSWLLDEFNEPLDGLQNTRKNAAKVMTTEEDRASKTSCIALTRKVPYLDIVSNPIADTPTVNEISFLRSSLKGSKATSSTEEEATDQAHVRNN